MPGSIGRGLRTIGYADPILILLKKTNVAILTGGGRHDAEEVTVWDPLHRAGNPLFVPRQEFEPPWSGDVLGVKQQKSSSTPPVNGVARRRLRPGSGRCKTAAAAPSATAIVVKTLL